MCGWPPLQSARSTCHALLLDRSCCHAGGPALSRTSRFVCTSVRARLEFIWAYLAVKVSGQVCWRPTQVQSSGCGFWLSADNVPACKLCSPRHYQPTAKPARLRVDAQGTATNPAEVALRQSHCTQAFQLDLLGYGPVCWVRAQAESGDFTKQQAARQQVEITQLQAKLVGAQAGVREAERHLQEERARLGNAQSNAELLHMIDTLQQEVGACCPGTRVQGPGCGACMRVGSALRLAISLGMPVPARLMAASCAWLAGVTGDAMLCMHSLCGRCIPPGPCWHSPLMQDCCRWMPAGPSLPKQRARQSRPASTEQSCRSPAPMSW